jgi:hypothetical protein
MDRTSSAGPGGEQVGCRSGIATGRRVIGPVTCRVRQGRCLWTRTAVTPAELDQLTQDCPYLYHMAARDSWPLISKHGLLPTDRLIDLFEVPEEEGLALTMRRRPQSTLLSHPSLGTATVRDQIPLLDRDLKRCLRDGLSPLDWYRVLNERVFFWLTERRLQRLLCASSYREQEHIVLKVRSADLIRDHYKKIELSPINSGATRPFPAPRGKDTFSSITDYPYTEWRKKRSKYESVVELTVIGGVQNIVDYVDGVSPRSSAGCRRPILRRSSSRSTVTRSQGSRRRSPP